MNFLSKAIFIHESKPIATNLLHREIFILDSDSEKIIRNSKNNNNLIDINSKNLNFLLNNNFINNNHEIYSKFTTKEEKTLNSLHIITTTRCSLNCDYCFVLLPTQMNNKDISFSDLFDGINFFFNHNTKDDTIVTFYGGEPLLLPDYIWNSIDYIENTLDRKIIKRIITNGTHLTKNIADKLKEYNFEIGISIDGLPSSHNKFRKFHNGKGSHSRIIKNVEYLKDEKIPFTILCTVGAHNVNNLIDHVKFLISLEPSSIELNMPRSIGSISTLEESKNSNIYINAYLKSLDLLYENNIPESHFLSFLDDFFNEPKDMSPCSACGTQLVLSPNGKVGPCQAHVMTGNYFIQKPTNNNVFSTKEFSKWADIKNSNSKVCNNCELFTLCTGDCPMDRERRFNNMLLPSSFFCELQHAKLNYFLDRCYEDKTLVFNTNKLSTDNKT